MKRSACLIAPVAASPSQRARPGRIGSPAASADVQPAGRSAFERFYLYDKADKDRPVGSGLGLAIVKQLATAMGGDVSVQSSENGTTFEVRLRPQLRGIDDLEVGSGQPAERV